MRDFCDGSIYKNNNFFVQNENGLQIQLYCDDFQAANPLGNRVKRCKVTAVYWTLGNLHPKPLLNDLQTLSSDGVKVSVHGEIYTFHGCVTFMSGDNLACNWLGGFFESFTSTRPCRYCRVPKENLRTTIAAAKFPMRSRTSYNRNADLVELDPSLSKIYGIKFRSPLNDIPHFHVIDGLAPDLAHDLFEGVVPEVLCNMIRYLVQSRFCTLDYVNDRIENFPYKGTDKTNKPLPMADSLPTLTIKQTAAQTWCLLRLLPLLIGDHVPRDDPVWSVLLYLQECVDLVCSEQHSTGSVAYLQVLIEKFMSSYIQYFPEEHIRPKGDLLLHYPHLSLKFGPIRHCWTLRFEAQHCYFKEIAHTLKNWKNLCFTLAKRHQLLQCLHNTNENFLDSCQLQETGGKFQQLSSFDKDAQQLIKHIIQDQEQVYTAKSVKYGGVTYELEHFLVLKVNGHDICFGQIIAIVIISALPRFLCQIWKVQYMKEHYHTLIIERDSHMKIVTPSQLADFYPLPAYQVDGELGIVPRHRFLAEYIFET
jgi:hypothetical protein